MDLSALIVFIPEPWRTYVLAALYAFLATQIAASGIVAVLPAKAFKWRPLRALSWYAHLAPRDAAGTVKLPFTAPLQPGAMEDLARLQAATARVLEMTAGHNLGASIDPPLAKAVRDVLAPPSTPTPPSNGQRGSARVGALLVICGVVLLATLAGAVLTGCPRLPPVSGCTPRAYRCTDSGRPEVCSTSQRWEPIGDEPCGAAGNVCVVDRTAHCAPIPVTADADGGAL